jgi:hypothetical protein
MITQALFYGFSLLVCARDIAVNATEQMQTGAQPFGDHGRSFKGRLFFTRWIVNDQKLAQCHAMLHFIYHQYVYSHPCR